VACWSRPVAAASGGEGAGVGKEICGSARGPERGIDGALGLRDFAGEMSVAEVIDEIRRLPAADLARVLIAVTNRTAELNGIAPPNSDSGPAEQEASETEFASAAERVFTEHRELLHRLAQ
jgi:hypothetical protein